MVFQLLQCSYLLQAAVLATGESMMYPPQTDWLNPTFSSGANAFRTTAWIGSDRKPPAISDRRVLPCSSIFFHWTCKAMPAVTWETLLRTNFDLPDVPIGDMSPLPAPDFQPGCHHSCIWHSGPAKFKSCTLVVHARIYQFRVVHQGLLQTLRLIMCRWKFLHQNGTINDHHEAAKNLTTRRIKIWQKVWMTIVTIVKCLYCTAPLRRWSLPWLSQAPAKVARVIRTIDQRPSRGQLTDADWLPDFLELQQPLDHLLPSEDSMPSQNATVLCCIRFWYFWLEGFFLFIQHWPVDHTNACGAEVFQACEVE